MPLCACSWGASPEAPSAWRPKSERDIALEHVRTPAMRSIYALMRRTALGDLRRSTRLACSTFATSRGISGIRSWPLPHPLRCRDEQFDLQPGACSGIHQNVQAELGDLALQQRVEASSLVLSSSLSPALLRHRAKSIRRRFEFPPGSLARLLFKRAQHVYCFGPVHHRSHGDAAI